MPMYCSKCWAELTEENECPECETVDVGRETFETKPDKKKARMFEKHPPRFKSRNPKKKSK